MSTLQQVINANDDVKDPAAYAAVLGIFNAYGDVVELTAKSKSLLKFGENDDIDAGVSETVWDLSGNEVYATTNAIDRIVSSNAADTQTISIEGHTVTGTGADAQFTFIVQTVTLNGQTPVALATPLARVSRAANTGSDVILGNVHVYEDSAVVAGVPSDLTKAHIKIAGASEGYQQSFKCATTFSNSDYFLLTNMTVSVGRTTSAAVDFELQLRQPGRVFRPIQRVTVNSAANANTQIVYNPYIIVPKNSDIRVIAVSTANNTAVDASFQGYLAAVV